mgnify:CR=1 FL=1
MYTGNNRKIRSKKELAIATGLKVFRNKNIQDMTEEECDVAMKEVQRLTRTKYIT